MHDSKSMTPAEFRPTPIDPKQLIYEAARDRHRAANPIPTGEGLTQLSVLREMPYRDRIRLASEEQIEAHPELVLVPKVYIASKSRHRPRWRGLRDTGGYNIISQWIDVPDEYIGKHPPDFDYKRLWGNSTKDIKSCDVIIAYAETGERLKGGLIEVGMALALNKEIMVVGDVTQDNGTWFHHEKVEYWSGSIEDLMMYLYGQES